MFDRLNTIAVTAAASVAVIAAMAGPASARPLAARSASPAANLPAEALVNVAGNIFPARAAAAATPGSAFLRGSAGLSVTTCSRAPAGAAESPCDARAFTAAEEEIIALMEAPGGNPETKPYDDTEGNCTIGIGHLIHAGSCTDADFDYWTGSRVTPVALEELFRKDLGKFDDWLNQNVVDPLHLKLDPCQYDALVDLRFNGGPSWFKQGGRLYEALKGGLMSAVPQIIATDVRANLSPAGKKDITARREKDANRFATKHCPCKFTEIYGTVTWTTRQDTPSNAPHNFGYAQESGTFVIDVISLRWPGSVYNLWTSAGSTFSVTDKADYGTVAPNCKYTFTRDHHGSGTLDYGPFTTANEASIEASWHGRYSPAIVGFSINVIQQETQTLTLKGSAAGCSGTTKTTSGYLFRPWCLNQVNLPGYFNGFYDHKKRIIPVRCRGTIKSTATSFRVSGTLRVLHSAANITIS